MGSPASWEQGSLHRSAQPRPCPSQLDSTGTRQQHFLVLWHKAYVIPLPQGWGPAKRLAPLPSEGRDVARRGSSTCTDLGLAPRAVNPLPGLPGQGPAPCNLAQSITNTTGGRHPSIAPAGKVRLRVRPEGPLAQWGQEPRAEGSWGRQRLPWVGGGNAVCLHQKINSSFRM